MFSEEKVSGDDKMFRLPAGYGLVMEPSGGEAVYPVTAYRNGNRNDKLLINSERAHVFEPWQYLDIETRAVGDAWWCTVLGQGERAGARGALRPVRIGGATVGGVLTAGVYELPSGKKLAPGDGIYVFDVRGYSSIFLETLHGQLALDNGDERVTVSLYGATRDGRQSLPTTPLLSYEYGDTGNNTSQRWAMYAGRDAGEEVAVGVLRTATRFPYVAVAVTVAALTAGEADLDDGVTLTLWGYP